MVHAPVQGTVGSVCSVRWLVVVSSQKREGYLVSIPSRSIHNIAEVDIPRGLCSSLVFSHWLWRNSAQEAPVRRTRICHAVACLKASNRQPTQHTQAVTSESLLCRESTATTGTEPLYRKYVLLFDLPEVLRNTALGWSPAGTNGRRGFLMGQKICARYLSRSQCPRQLASPLCHAGGPKVSVAISVVVRFWQDTCVDRCGATMAKTRSFGNDRSPHERL